MEIGRGSDISEKIEQGYTTRTSRNEKSLLYNKNTFMFQRHLTIISPHEITDARGMRQYQNAKT